MRKQTSASLERIAADYVAILDERAASLNKLLADSTTSQQAQLASLHDEFVEGADVLRDTIVQRKDEIEKLAGVIANTGMTSGYQSAAAEAKVTGRVWQTVTIVAMLGFIGLAIYAFLPATTNEFHWPSFAGRVFVTLSVAVLAGYAGSQADKQQKAERYNRRLALELQAIGPYVAALPEDKRHEFILKIGERSFGRGDTSEDEKSPTSTADLLASKDVRSLLTDLVKAGRG
jgi:hypothetical protein